MDEAPPSGTPEERSPAPPTSGEPEATVAEQPSQPASLPGRADAVTPLEIPYRFPGAQPAGQIEPAYPALAPGAGSGVRAIVAGRAMRVRRQGGVAFADLRDSSGTVQLFAEAAVTPSFDAFTELHFGDWIGASGEIVRTKRGQVSVHVEDWVLLARARRSLGDPWHGVTDPDVRFRQREVDLWANEGVRAVFALRSRTIASLRRTLGERGFLEVETPVLLPIPSGGHALPFATHFNALHADFYLRIALELYLKRLVVGGFERVYEIGRVFRNEGLSPRHNPEFTMLEAYQAYADYTDMMELTEQLAAGAARDGLGRTLLSYQGRELDLTPPWRRATMEELIAEHTGEQLVLGMGRDELARRAAALGVDVPPAGGAGSVLFAIYEKTVEASLWQPVHVMDYPKEVSPLARDHRDKPGYVERFESVVAGRELANCFSELADPDEQRRRLDAQAEAREAGDEEAMRLDEEFLRALEHGMPPTGGLGMGVDRLVMLLADVSSIREVLFFPALRPPREQDGTAGQADPGGDG